MPWIRVYDCPDCEFKWEVLLRRRTDATPAADSKCRACGGAGTKALAAPNLGRGAQPETTMKIPQGNKTKQIDFAMRVISEDNHGANMKSSMQIGETANIPIPLKPQDQPTWGGAGKGIDFGAAMSMAAQDPTRGHGGLLNKLADKRQSTMAPVYRPAKPA